MLEIPTLRQLIDQAKGDLGGDEEGALKDTLRISLAVAIAFLTYGLYKALQYLSRQLFPDTAEDAFVALWASVFGLVPNPATQAAGPIQITSTAAGAAVVGGEVLTGQGGAEYTIDAGAVFGPTQELTVDVTAVESGDAGNLGIGEILTFVAPPLNVNSTGTVLTPGIEGGFDTESIADLQTRLLAFIRSPRRGGSEPDYVVWALAASTGVGAAFANGSFAGIGTVQVLITQKFDPAVPGDTPIPPTSLIQAVEDYIEPRRPAGLHGVFVVGPVLKELKPFILLDPDSAEIRDSVTRALGRFLATVGPKDEFVRYDDMVDAINRAAGEIHHQLWVDDGAGTGPNNFSLASDEIAVVGPITWTAPP